MWGTRGWWRAPKGHHCVETDHAEHLSEQGSTVGASCRQNTQPMASSELSMWSSGPCQEGSSLALDQGGANKAEMRGGFLFRQSPAMPMSDVSGSRKKSAPSPILKAVLLVFWAAPRRGDTWHLDLVCGCLGPPHLMSLPRNSC